MKARILWIEGKRAEGPSFIPGLRKKGYQVDVVSSGSEALTRLGQECPDLIILYAASLRTSGKRICRSLRDADPSVPILVIAGAEKPLGPDACASAVLMMPFTARKLLNAVEPLLPWEQEELFVVGPITLDLERKRVRCGERSARLNPHLTALLKILMEHPGEVLERERLFREVWMTDYTKDTRTLDVHMSWLREALEEDPRHPVHLKTVRGVGYRLDV